ncbi:MAG: hypothetical protein ACFCA4_12525 [Cyanophyceae cyanobacterium]
MDGLFDVAVVVMLLIAAALGWIGWVKCFFGDSVDIWELIKDKARSLITLREFSSTQAGLCFFIGIRLVDLHSYWELAGYILLVYGAGCALCALATGLMEGILRAFDGWRRTQREQGRGRRMV